MGRRSFTRAEDRHLRRLVRRGVKWVAVAIRLARLGFPRRTVGALSRRAWRLGVAPGRQVDWAAVLAAHGAESDAAIARLTGRTGHDVRRARKRHQEGS